MNRAPLVLVVDDEPSIRQFLQDSLKSRGFAVEQTGTGEGALLLAASLHPQLILLDLGLPDWDGQALVREIRRGGSTPILVLSARDQEQEKVAALNAGADDYLTKPFGLDELVARMGVALRHVPAGPPVPANPVPFGDLVWNVENQQVFLAGEPVHLTPLEYRLFTFFAQRPGRLLTHGVLLREVWGLSNLELIHYVRVAVGTLRKKLKDGQDGRRFIGTEVGTGYRFLG